ncbi:ADP-ribose pyrophosphatase YjhB (NUDIX family) [Stackebrandtia albiflava]|uniref:ADP-ribose pyrophosphatase YjhB (NUDIX family) n=1 Tax=Stackebrandtia albiflava TaxID=406432 RepID=A0A562UQP9_9ACTN|nr:NUDIX hydrolase [Stackebrandtia albiflava]TWJ07926.1 ADP-ribose pyrophosphatase YjhB (NUDIX family) [Stackebrandtia albiflava]
MDRTMRVGAYGILSDDAGRILMRRATEATGSPDSWWLPGGRVKHAEDPADTVARTLSVQTGLDVEITALRTVTSAVVPMTDQWREHHTLIVYDLKTAGGELAPERENARNLWVDPTELAGQPMSQITSTMLGLSETGLPPGHGRAPEPPPGKLLEQRVGAYAWLTDPAGRVLLTMIPEGYWAAGKWHLPGGGVDFGEQPEAGLLREIHEETSQRAVLTGLRRVVSRHDPDSITPDGRPSDFHGINLIWDGVVPNPSQLTIVDVGGSTSEVRWFEPADIPGLPKTVAVEAGLDP